jgi:hypothetical protein
VYEQGLHRLSQSASSSPQKSREPQINVQAEHVVVTPSQVTCPGSLTPQLPSTAVQLVVLLLPVQLTVPPFAQFAVALHKDLAPI